MYEGERDHCHSVSAIFSLISSQNFICQLNHCRQTPQSVCVFEGGCQENEQKRPIYGYKCVLFAEINIISVMLKLV